MGNITQKWVDVLLPFSGDYSAKLSASELARRTRLPQQTVSRNLNEMLKLNLISHERVGKNKLFYFDAGRESTRLIFTLLEVQKAVTFLKDHKEIAVVVEELLDACETVVIFGSYASGTAGKSSDLDVLFLGKCKKARISALKRKVHLEINEQYSSYSEFEKLLKAGNPLAIEIMKNHLIFGNTSALAGIFLKTR